MSKISTDWFRDARWGIFIHYLGRNNETADQWNAEINQFNIPGLINQLKELNPGYLIFTIGQISGCYCSPNATYDSIVGISPSKCSKRDLIFELGQAVTAAGMRFLVYFPSDAPRDDKVATKQLGWVFPKSSWEKWARWIKTPKNVHFQQNWEAIIREYSLRWGKLVSGWWIDGCYYADSMYRKKISPNFASFAAAIRAGNPDSIIAFNPGVKVPIIAYAEEEDFTAGEIGDELPKTHPDRWVNGEQYHILTYLGKWWGEGHPRFTAPFIHDYTEQVIKNQGVISWDVGVSRDGLILPELYERLKILKDIRK
jgi:hypothetical protein